MFSQYFRVGVLSHGPAKGDAPLLDAAQKGDAEEVKCKLEKGVVVNMSYVDPSAPVTGKGEDRVAPPQGTAIQLYRYSAAEVIPSHLIISYVHVIPSYPSHLLIIPVSFPSHLH